LTTRLRDQKGRFLASPPPDGGNGDLLANAGAAAFAALAELSRMSLAGYMGRSYDDRRKLYNTLGYPTEIRFEDYHAKYRRARLAKAIVDLPVEWSWAEAPEIVDSSKPADTEFEKAVRALTKKRKLWHYMERADKLAGIGRYSILLLGFDDGGELNQPVESASELLYVMPYSEDNAKVGSYDDDPKSERCGQPEHYSVTLDAARASSKGGGSSFPRVHWTRVVHVAEQLLESDVHAIPRLEAVYNDLIDLEKVVGGSAEMFWRGARKEIIFNVLEGAMKADITETRTAIAEWQDNLREVLMLQNMEAKSMAPKVASPKDHVDVLLQMISATYRIPKRILMGAELGELSSSADERRWGREMARRRLNHNEPHLVRPCIDRLVTVGVLPPSSGPDGAYDVRWAEISSPSDAERAEVGAHRAKAIKDYVEAEGWTLVHPEMFLRRELGYTDEDIELNSKLLEDLERRASGRDEGRPPEGEEEGGAER
jgi:hypothetical protein